MSAEPLFIFLCTENRRDLYRGLLRDTPYPYRFHSNVEQLLIDCLKSPPLAIIVDLRSLVAIGSDSMKNIYNLKTVWPVMRCNVHQDGSATVMCLEPNRTEKLLEALADIAAGDEGWIASGKFRKFLRLPLCLRTRIREADQPWEKGNTVDVSVRGAFVVNYQDHSKDTPIEVELYDLTDTGPLRIEGTIRWLRSWDEPGKLAGVGIAFEPGPDVEILTEEIAKRGVKSVSR